jgi:hypothetical protein
MKTKINILKIILASLAVVTFFSCENPIGLGQKLDIEGPVVTIISPTQRQSVPAQFDLEGTVQDFTGVDIMTIKAVTNNQDFARQWRYQRGAWEISDNYGAIWSPLANIVWTDTNGLITWKIPIDMALPGQRAVEGEYTFNIQAWDKGGFTDDNSFKALVLIIDQDPPKVIITNPYLYSKYAYDSDPLFITLDGLPDGSNDWQDTSYLGKFITQEFDLKWQIEDASDVWSINLSFYPHDTVIDNDPDTPLPNDYIYRYYKNTPPPPSGANPNDYVKLNGSVIVPNLYAVPGIYDGGELKSSNDLKATVKVVAVCYDAAGNPNQEKTLGYFISWPKANTPWIVFTDGMEPPDGSYGRYISYDKDQSPPLPDNYAYVEDNVFTVYPGRSIKGTAFQAHGVKEVKYTLYKLNIEGNTLHTRNDAKTEIEQQNEIIPNPPFTGGTFSTIFPWEFKVPPFTGYYVFTIEAFSSQGVPSANYEMLFRVHDITFPSFTEGPYPIATEPLFMNIDGAGKITISGKVSDATEIRSLCMVWINPESKDYSAMSQLAYFRDANYPGWKAALNLTPGTWDTEKENIPLYGDKYPYDSSKPNKLWRLELTGGDIDWETNKKVFNYSQTIDLSGVLNIGIGKQPLKSQVFLLRAENPDGKCTVITYAPQGDTLAPRISISNVKIKNGTRDPVTYESGKYAVIPQFNNGDTITINGTWWEDSVHEQYLDINTYFKDNFKITVNNQEISGINLNRTGGEQGDWNITVNVGGGGLSPDKLKDTLVVGVTVKDIGGNTAEAGSSWLIQSDNLRLMRISSEKEDGTYKADETIVIFLEFSKPVILTNPGSGTPELILSSDTGSIARAVYQVGNNQNSRQYFEYKVSTGNTTGTGYLNVKGLYYNGEYTSSTSFGTNDYPFTWSRGTSGSDDYEEVRITMQTKAGTPPYYDGNTKETSGYYVRTLPTATTSTDPNYQFTLLAGKHFTIDTQAPSVKSITRNSNAGDYRTGDIYFTVNFSEEVKIGTTPPSFPLRLGNGGASKNASFVRVNGEAITFMYNIQDGDTSNGNQIYVSSTIYTGNITDLAGNPLPVNAMVDLSENERTLTGIYVDTVKPSTPVVRILSAAGTGTTANALTNSVGASDIKAESGAVAIDLKNLYHNNLYLAIEGMSKDAWDLTSTSLEYSINNGVSWTTFNSSSPIGGNTTNTGVPLSQTGTYQIKARQIDRAGNVSDESNTVNFTWDKGNLITRISSTSANGVYTNNITNGGTRTDTINITVNFRKPVRFGTNQPQITLSNISPAATLSATGYTSGSTVTELSFTYAVAATANTAAGLKLDVSNFVLNGASAQDNDNVSVSDYLKMPASNLATLKDITVQTGALTRTGITTSDSLVTGGGIQADGSYNTALVLTFNHNIVKGKGTITIIQQTTDYRLPAVLMESQFSKYRNIINVNNYYTRGSNGYNYTDAANRGADTSTKYILSYSVDTAATANAPNATGSDVQKLAEAFRQAEKVVLDINAQAVRINPSNQNQLIVELTGTNTLQVPGVTYEVSYPGGFVQNSLDTPCAATASTIPISGIAKPFIRINKKQESITVSNNPTNRQPRLVAVQPFKAEVRMDCRTPNTTIRYTTLDASTNVTSQNWNTSTNTPVNQQPAGPHDLTNPAAPAQPADPNSTPTPTGRTNYSAPFEIGDNNYQGYQWYVRARASIGTGGNESSWTWSAASEEMAFRTVVTYDINNMSATDGIRPGNTTADGVGDQIWIRGGDAIGSSSVPGFPLTWDITNTEFNTLKTDMKRAGIRLFTMTSVTTSATANNGFWYASTWKWITWDINTDAYFDIILGREPAANQSTANEAWQYGPKQWSYQRAGWTAFKEQCRILPGKHRWLSVVNGSVESKGAVNFSQTFNIRPFSNGDVNYVQP